jgi:hypothetical protein
MEQSILTSTKQILGIPEEDVSFDQAVLTFINTSFTDLLDLGIGPEDGFRIVDADSEWEDYIDDSPALDRVKTYVYLKVRLLFDPPQTSFHIAAMEKQVQEVVWRLSIVRENIEWVDPEPPVVVIDE